MGEPSAGADTVSALAQRIAMATLSGSGRYKPLIGSEEELSQMVSQSAQQTAFVLLESGRDGSRWDAVPDLDRFFIRLYHYYLGKGFYTILLTQLVNILILAFVILFSTYLMAFVDWHLLLDSYDLDAALKPVDPSSMNGFLLLSFLVFSAFWCWHFIRFFFDIRANLEIKAFVNQKLGVSERDIQTILWHELVQKILKVQETQRLCIVKDRITALDLVNRIMRKENYMIALLNKDILDISVPLPLLRDRRILTKTLEWSISICVMNYLFDQHSSIRKKFLTGHQKEALAAGLRRRFVVLGFVAFVFSPFIFLFLILYFFFRYAEEFKSRPSSLAMRGWSPLAKWQLREYNELPHVFRKRLSESNPHAQRYVDQFPSHKIAAAARLVTFVVGAIAAVLVIVTIFDESILLNIEVAGKSVLWYIGIFGTVLGITRPFILDENHIFEPEVALREVVKHTHHLPKEWRNNAHVYGVRQQFTTMFQYKVHLFVQELLGVVLTPLVLCFSLPKSSGAILEFVREFTVLEDGVGHVCAFALFNFAKNGNYKYTGIGPRKWGLESRQAKMEKSFLSFKMAHPGWEPPESATQFLNNISSMYQDPSSLHESLMSANSNPLPFGHRSSHSQHLMASHLSEGDPQSAYEAMDRFYDHGARDEMMMPSTIIDRMHPEPAPMPALVPQSHLARNADRPRTLDDLADDDDDDDGAGAGPGPGPGDGPGPGAGVGDAAPGTSTPAAGDPERSEVDATAAGVSLI